MLFTSIYLINTFSPCLLIEILPLPLIYYFHGIFHCIINYGTAFEFVNTVVTKLGFNRLK